MSDYSVTLSTTEPNNYVGLIKLRQGDVASQSIQATITANGQLFNFNHLAVFFNAVLPNGNVIRDKVTEVDYINSKLNYIVADSFLQEVAQVTAWFSFENDEKIIDSTKNFQYSVIAGWKECIPQGNYIYELSEIQREIEEIIGNKDFSSLLKKIGLFETNISYLDYTKADKKFVDEQFASIVSGAPKGTFATLAALQTAYPSGTEGVFLVSENGHWYYYASGWKDGGVYQGLILSKSESDKLISKNQSLFNWIDNSILNKDLTIPYQAQDGATGVVVERNDKKWFQIVGTTTNTKRQQIICRINKDSDKYYYGGDGEITIRNEGATSNFNAFVNVITSTSGAQVPCFSTTIAQNDQNLIKFTVPPLSKSNFNFGDITEIVFVIRTENQDNIKYMISGHKIYTNPRNKVDVRSETKQKELDLNNKFLSNQTTTLDYNNWVKNSSMIGALLPFQAQDGLKGEVIQKSSRNWYQVSTAGSNTNRQKLVIFPTVVDDSDKYYYGGEGQFTIRNEAAATNFDVFVSVYTKTDAKQFLINRFYLLPNKNLLFKFIFPKLSELSGFAFQDVTQVAISIRPEIQEVIKFRITDVLIKTMPSYIRDITVQELPSFDAKKSIFPRVDLSGDFDSLTATETLMMPFRFQNQEFVVEGVSETKWQGNSSKNLPKKNIRVKLYNDEQKTKKKKVQLNQSFPKTEKYNLKANYIDRFQVRNLMNSMLSYQMFATRKTLNEPIDSIPFGGQVKGFPCVVYINNEFYGLFTFNTAKDSSMLLLSDETNQLAIQGFLNSSGTKFYANHVTVAVDGTTEDFEILFPEKLPDESQQADIDRLFTFVNSSNDTDFIANFDSYYDLTSVIDWMLLIDATGQTDMNGKNIIHVTYDRKKWFAVPYDQDNSYGVHFTGEIETDTDFNILDPENDINKLFKRVLKNFPNKIIERYDLLVKKDILTVTNVHSLYRNFIDILPQEFVEMDQEKWSQNKAYSILDYERTMFLIAKRFKLIEEHINKLR